MLRYDKTRYIALGLPSLLNAAILVYALDIDTSALPDDYAARFYLVLAGGLALFGASAMIKRARDMGSSAWGILFGFLFAPPLMLLIAIILCFIASNPEADRLEPAPPPASTQTWLSGLALLALPWIAVLAIQALTVM